jgi:hypothetical protein
MAMSAFTSRADVYPDEEKARFVPTAEVECLFDHLVGGRK